MSKGKKSYCRISFLFLLAVLVFTIGLCFPKTGVSVYAALPQQEDIQDLTNDNEVDNTADATDDEVNGFSIIYNNDSGSISTPIRMFLVLTILAVAPSILIMMTSFTRIVVVLHFVRTAIGTQTSPPNNVMVGLALFLTFFIMWPTFQQINTTAIQPLDEGKITWEQALEEAQVPLREFMYGETEEKDLALFVELSGETYESVDEIPFMTIVPAFILSELRTAFIIGFFIYIPFIVIDMVVSSVLMSMGMMMLPPTTISLPFKILLFVLADGWDLIIKSLVQTFQ